MTEGDWNLVFKMIESRLEREGASRCDGRGVEAVVGARWLASVLVENERLRQQVTEVQAHNTALLERARLAEKDRDEAYSLSRIGIECAERMCADARAETDDLAAACEARGLAIEDMAKRLAETGADLARVTKELGVERAALVGVTASRDALASSSVPVELARLYRVAQRMLAKMGDDTQRLKLAEECAEYIAEAMREDERFCAERLYAELHDVLTVALSLCEPALMAKAAERLEGRLK